MRRRRALQVDVHVVVLSLIQLGTLTARSAAVLALLVMMMMMMASSVFRELGVVLPFRVQRGAVPRVQQRRGGVVVPAGPPGLRLQRFIRGHRFFGRGGGVAVQLVVVRTLVMLGALRVHAGIFIVNHTHLRTETTNPRRDAVVLAVVNGDGHFRRQVLSRRRARQLKATGRRTAEGGLVQPMLRLPLLPFEVAIDRRTRRAQQSVARLVLRGVPAVGRRRVHTCTRKRSATRPGAPGRDATRRLAAGAPRRHLCSLVDLVLHLVHDLVSTTSRSRHAATSVQIHFRITEGQATAGNWICPAHRRVDSRDVGVELIDGAGRVELLDFYGAAVDSVRAAGLPIRAVWIELKSDLAIASLLQQNVARGPKKQQVLILLVLETTVNQETHPAMDWL
mmetsp:Transcript_11836/g.28684  ORF Transcript_11836/g.28684 Transcript_11836/m.28684 type:complete len:393 (+) Transcript_11836:4130-5308(+)